MLRTILKINIANIASDILFNFFYIFLIFFFADVRVGCIVVIIQVLTPQGIERTSFSVRASLD